MEGSPHGGVMPWVKIDDGAPLRDSWFSVGVEAQGFHVAALAYSNRTLAGGKIPQHLLPLVSPGTPPRRALTLIAKLVAAGMWTTNEGGWQIVEDLDKQPTPDEVRAEREWNSKRRELYSDASLLDEVRRRDCDSCRYCGREVSWKDRRGPRGATYDHVVPRGPNTVDNIVVACRACNSAKSGRTPEQAGMLLRPHKSDLDSDLSPTQNGASSDPATRTRTRTRTRTESSRKETGSIPPRKSWCPGFEHFWALYPNKVGKQAALDRWRKDKLEPKAEAIVAGLERTMAYVTRDGGTFEPNPATWLHEGRWDDEPRDLLPMAPKTQGNVDAARAFVERHRHA